MGSYTQMNYHQITERNDIIIIRNIRDEDSDGDEIYGRVEVLLT